MCVCIVVSVGTAPLLSIQCGVGGLVKVSSLSSIGSSVVAGKIQLEPLSQ